MLEPINGPLNGRNLVEKNLHGGCFWLFVWNVLNLLTIIFLLQLGKKNASGEVNQANSWFFFFQPSSRSEYLLGPTSQGYFIYGKSLREGFVYVMSSCASYMYMAEPTYKNC